VRQADEKEICGLGVVKEHEGETAQAPDALLKRLEQRTRGAREQWLAAMQSHPSDKVQAAGLLLGAVSSLDVNPAAPGVEGRAALRDRLARMAVDSADPVVYAFAMNACRSARSSNQPGACQMLSTEQWVRIDGDNAAAWLQAAALAGKDAAGEAEALRRAAQSTHLQSYWASLAPLVQSTQPSGADELLRTMMLVDVGGVISSWPVVEGLQVASRHCAVDRLRDSNRRELCEGLATLLVDRGDTMVDLSTGIGIGERLGWPSARVEALKREKDGFAAAMSEPATVDDPLSCRAVQWQWRHFDEVARLGEVAALRAAVERSGRSIDELARLTRDRQGTARERAADREDAVASAASPASAVRP
jgi:hypothetical protein